MKQINVTLWDGYAQQFANYLENNKQPPMLVVIQYGKISYYRGLFITLVHNLHLKKISKYYSSFYYK